MARRSDFEALLSRCVTFHGREGDGPHCATVVGTSEAMVALRFEPDCGVIIPIGNLTLRRKDYGDAVAVVVRVKP